jgi:hypothetical protein
MPSTSFALRGQHVGRVTLEVADIRAEGAYWRPILHLPLKLSLMPLGGPDAAIGSNFYLLQTDCELYYGSHEELASFQVPWVVEQANPQPYERDFPIRVELSPLIVQRIEELRSGKDPQFELELKALVSLGAGGNFDKVRAQSRLAFAVPRSTWTDRVLEVWKLGRHKLIDIEFPHNRTGEQFKKAYTKLEEAEKHFSNGQWRETLASIYAAFELLAKSRKFSKPDQQFFAALLADHNPVTKESAKRMLDSFCAFLHLGRHETAPADSPRPVAGRNEARLSLITAHAVFEYLSKY